MAPVTRSKATASRRTPAAAAASKSRRSTSQAKSKSAGGQRSTASASRSRSARRSPPATAAPSRSRSTAGNARTTTPSTAAAPEKPKRAMTAYQAFVQSQLKGKSVGKDAFAATMKDLGDQWRDLTDAQKARYKARATLASKRSTKAPAAPPKQRAQSRGSRQR